MAKYRNCAAFLTSRMYLFIILTCVAAIDPLPGYDMLGGSVDPVTLNKGINVFNASTLCQTPDHKYLIACGVNAIPILNYNTEMISMSYTSTTQYMYDGSSQFSFSASAEFPQFQISGHYGQSILDYVNTFSDQSTVMISTTADMQMYEMSLEDVVFPLSDSLLQVIQFLSNAISSNDTSAYSTWMYYLVNNLHAATITTVYTGARLEEFFYVYKDYYASTEIQTSQGCAEVQSSFAGIFGGTASTKWHVTTEEIETFQENIDQSIFNVVGGNYENGMTLAQWQATAYQNPATLAYIATPSNIYLTPQVLSKYGVDSDHAAQIYRDYTNTIGEYLTNNSYYGCSDSFAVNFNLSTTIDDGNCDYASPNNSSFAGYYAVYGTCYNEYTICAPNAITINNLYTEILSCPTSSDKISLTRENIDGGTVTILNLVACMHENMPAFGGIYDTSTVNPITQGFNCPTGMTSTKLYGDVSICLTNDPTATSYPFNGYYITSSTGLCIGNDFTASGCSCPDTSFKLLTLTDQTSSDFGALVYTLWACFGITPSYITPNNTGGIIPLNYPASKAYTLPSTETTIPWLIITIVVFSILTVSQIAMIMTIIILCRRRGNYQPID